MKPFRNDLTTRFLRKTFNYDAKTGFLTWRIKPAARVKIGDAAGTKGAKGELHVEIHGMAYLVHRLIWKWVTGRWPKKQIDHRNLNSSDNSWKNLREATNAQNCRNRRRSRVNTSGYKGASYKKSLGKWQAQIKVDGRVQYLGVFMTALAAHRAYCRAAKKMHRNFARLK